MEYKAVGQPQRASTKAHRRERFRDATPQRCHSQGLERKPAALAATYDLTKISRRRAARFTARLQVLLH